jgi:hypothetical protein
MSKKKKVISCNPEEKVEKKREQTIRTSYDNEVTHDDKYYSPIVLEEDYNTENIEDVLVSLNLLV